MDEYTAIKIKQLQEREQNIRNERDKLFDSIHAVLSHGPDAVCFENVTSIPNAMTIIAFANRDITEIKKKIAFLKS